MKLMFNLIVLFRGTRHYQHQYAEYLESVMTESQSKLMHTNLSINFEFKVHLTSIFFSAEMKLSNIHKRKSPIFLESDILRAFKKINRK